jgi:hypothetical protein
VEIVHGMIDLPIGSFANKLKDVVVGDGGIRDLFA